MNIFSLFYLLVLLLLPSVILYLCMRRIELALSYLFITAFFLIILYMVNEFIPLSGGDDSNYYNASLRNLGSWRAWIDFSQFRNYEQGGYPLVLTWLNQIIGESLYLKKALNLELFFLLSIIWYAIGDKLGGKCLGGVFALGIILATPLWYYWMFLLKDMTIIFLQSLYIYFLINFVFDKKKLFITVVLILCILLVIPFRVHLAVADIILFLFAMLISYKVKVRILATTVLTIVAISVILIVGYNRNALKILGVYGENRDLSVKSVESTAEKFMKYKNTHFRQNVQLFPILYLFGEVSTFNKGTWGRYDHVFFRGITAAPWIFIGVPLFFSGLYFSLFARRSYYYNNNAVIFLNTDAKLVIYILLFNVIIYSVISWIVMDTTRWRLPVFPSMAGIAAYGWASIRSRTKFIMLITWFVFLSFSLTIYYVLLK